MIHTISSDLATFKTLKFHKGLNVLLADKSEGATDMQSRNGAGKSSFVEIVHFLLGAEADSRSIFRTASLKDSTFYMEFDLAGESTSVGRCGAHPSDVQILHGATRAWPYQPKIANMGRPSVSMHPTLSNVYWREVLGAAMFGIRENESETGVRFEPKFRQLFAYFARRQSSGAFQLPTSQGSKQQDWDVQLAISYLLGLDWTIPKRLQELRVREKTIKELRAAIKDGGLSNVFASAAELKTKLTLTDARLKRLATELAEFRVVPEYGALEEEANEATIAISRLSDENSSDRAFLSRLQDTLRSEEAPGMTMLEKMYAEAGVVLPGKVIERFESVIGFHQAVVENRRSHLRSEIEQAERRLSERAKEMTRLDARRSQIMKVLKTGGALESYTRMQEELARAEGEAESLRRSIGLAEEIESKRTAASIERKQLYQRLQEDHHEQSARIRHAILTFEELSTAMYEKTGSLLVDATENGPKFEVAIEGARSRGITNMQIFCFDIMLTILAQERGAGPGFLIHDSHLFDGVDERQVAKALQIGSENAERYGFQYVVTMNSDALPKEGFHGNFDIRPHILKPLLTDKTDTGGLFGMRFN